MIATQIAYLAFATVSAALFVRTPTRHAILICFLGGWILLPVGSYPVVDDPSVFPWWITGLALPSDILLNKSWVVPSVVLLFAGVADFKAVRQFRPGPLDACMLIWCLWPFVSGMNVPSPDPSPILAAALVSGAWGTTWLLGRIWFTSTDAQILLLKGLVWSGAVCLPIAIIEGAFAVKLYELVYSIHPFHLDGWDRYVGNRPIGFFEHGNQYGIWVAMAAIAAFWLPKIVVTKSQKWLQTMLLIVVSLMVIAAQSVGAIFFLLMASFAMLIWRLRITGILVFGGIGVIVLIGGLHISGIVPLEWIARETAIGQAMLDLFRSMGRGSFMWRISQDLKNLSAIKEALLTGTAVWDWWRPSGTRPWGLWLLLVGQFGLIGLLFSYGTVGCAALFRLFKSRSISASDRSFCIVPLALIVIFALLDSGLNAFLYFPALLVAGGISRSSKGAVPAHQIS